MPRREAVTAGLKRYFTGVPCKNGHVCERITQTARCLDCILMCNRKKKSEDPERYRRYTLKNTRKFRAAHPEADHQYYEKNKGRLAIRNKDWQQKNVEKMRKVKSAYKQRNPHKRNEHETYRRARKLNATPEWLSDEQRREMQDVYALAQKLGPSYQVDHIVPLKGRLVCGLHVPWNLRVITAAENAVKGNRLIDA